MKPQAGNAIVVILIAVFLFGALAATFMRGAKTGQGNLSDQQARLAANEIVAYSQAIDKSVNRLSQRGCAESQLEFENFAMFNCGPNADAPVDKSCTIFHPNGGGLNTREFLSLPNMRVMATGGSALEEVGTWDSGDPDGHQDIVLWFGPLPLNVCKALNEAVRNDPDPPAVASSGESWCFNNVNGSPHFGGTNILLGTLAGKKAGCIEQTDTPADDDHLPEGYNFFYTLFER